MLRLAVPNVNTVKLEGRTVLITGASGGIGRALAHRFAELGCRLILTARSKDLLDELAAELRTAGTTVIPADLTDTDSLAGLCDQVVERFDHLDILINNAGVGLYAPSFESRPEKVQQLFELNFFAPVELVRRLLPLIPSGGSVVNVSSIAGKVPLPWLNIYSASKYALNAYSDGLRMELEGSGIQVLCVCPGYVGTDFSQNVIQGAVPQKVTEQKKFKITAEQCAQAIVDGITKRKRTVVTPVMGWGLTILARLLPSTLYSRMAKMNPAGLLINRR